MGNCVAGQLNNFASTPIYPSEEPTVQLSAPSLPSAATSVNERNSQQRSVIATPSLGMQARLKLLNVKPLLSNKPHLSDGSTDENQWLTPGAARRVLKVLQERAADKSRPQTLPSDTEVVSNAPWQRSLASLRAKDQKLLHSKALPTETAFSSIALELVKDILKAVREDIYKPGLKSDNKRRTDRPFNSNENENTFQEIRRIRRSSDPLSAAFTGSAHDCRELSSIAQAVMSEMGFSAHLYSLPGHVVAICIGTSELKSLGRNMRDWPEHALVCDPWANIACSAREFPTRFLEKMQKWSSEGKEIYYANHSPKWADPIHSGWTDLILRSVGAERVS